MTHATQQPMDQLLAHIRAHKPGIATDSRRITSGDVFVAVPGVAVDGGDFIPAARERGASAIVCRPEKAAACGDTPHVVHDDPRVALGLLAQARFGTDALSFPVVGVTGTNGKTTVTYLLDHLFAASGRRTGVLGTVAYRWPGHSEDAPLTTPDCLQLHAMLGCMQQAGVDAAFMEVSSHALDQHRVAGISFAGAVLTNVTQDHLDYHGDMESYFAAKERLFRSVPLAGKPAAINVDDAYGRRMLAGLPGGIGYGLAGAPVEGARHLQGEVVRSSTAGLHLRMTFEGQTWELTSPLVGSYNASNLLAVQAVGLGLGLGPDAFARLSGFMGVPGRLERIANPSGLDVFVDYAHTPDALINVLRALRAVGFGRIITVFGCGGNRDKTKRPLMGQAVAAHSDVAVLTSDNPRHEEPEAIMADVMPGLAAAAQVVAEADRRKALARALEIMRPGDALLVAGKGHESYQQIGDRKVPFSDQQTIRELLGCN